MCKGKGWDNPFLSVGRLSYHKEMGNGLILSMYARDRDFYYILKYTYIVLSCRALAKDSIYFSFFTKSSLNKSKDLN